MQDHTIFTTPYNIMRNDKDGTGINAWIAPDFVEYNDVLVQHIAKDPTSQP